MKYYEVKEIDNIIIIKSNKDLTYNYCNEIFNYLKSNYYENNKRFIINMENVRWIDSVGLGLLAYLAKISIFNDSKLCITGINNNLISLLKISGLLPVVVIFETEEEAINYLK